MNLREEWPPASRAPGTRNAKIARADDEPLENFFSSSQQQTHAPSRLPSGQPPVTSPEVSSSPASTLSDPVSVDSLHPASPEVPRHHQPPQDPPPPIHLICQAHLLYLGTLQPPPASIINNSFERPVNTRHISARPASQSCKTADSFLRALPQPEVEAYVSLGWALLRFAQSQSRHASVSDGCLSTVPSAQDALQHLRLATSPSIPPIVRLVLGTPTLSTPAAFSAFPSLTATLAVSELGADQARVEYSFRSKAYTHVPGLMTDHQPEITATADLTPESPKPINLSSPMAVPTLQDQADSLSTMGLSPTLDRAAPAGTANEAHVPPSVPSTAQDLSSSSTNDALTRDAVDASQSQAEYTENADEGLGLGQSTQTDAEHTRNSDASNPSSGNAEQDAPSSDSNAVTSEAVDANAANRDASILQPDQASTSGQDPTPSALAPSHPQPAQDATESDATAMPAETSPQDQSAAATSASNDASSTGEGIDIQALVDKITASSAAAEPTTEAINPTTPGGASAQSSLPPKPPASQQPSAADLRAEEIRRFPSNVAQPLQQGTSMSYSYPAPGTVADAPGYNPSQVYADPGASMSITPQYGVSPTSATNPQSSSQRWDDFLKEERKYVSEAKWDRFPDGSRLFIGNLSSERVSKREVFDIFSRYGRLAQISLKQAYGFVQYHTVVEGQAAMDALQGIEISGRKIHLELSRAQKKDGDNDRRGNRGSRGGNERGRDNDRYDGRRKDGYRPRSPSPARGGHNRQDSYGRDRGHWEPPSNYSRRGRSRSPGPYTGGNYRQRSPSPHRRGPPTSEADLDIPRRYGGEVPDVQLLLLQEVNRDFVTWVQGAFSQRGLKVDVMFVNPRLPRDLVIQRQVVEGVLAVCELDFRTQGLAKIPLQTYDRSAGRHNTRYDQYQDLDPPIAAEIVLRIKSQAQQPSPAGYGGGSYPPGAYASAPQPQYAPQPHQAYPAAAPANLNLGGLDNATLQKVLSAIQGAPQGGTSAHMGAVAPGVDVNAVLNALSANGAAAAPSHQQPMAYPGAAAPSIPGNPGAAPGNPADQAHVQNIMAQLSRYRQ
ncbi:uncharacterized protein JN550_005290 [Neoarthrinium moseri]|uniref:uncharacterized protein n=1 Tax=Neoarthrinium moseri TaxID=1658444 RepID=UPI001FDE90E7|nr:uncharacterized protein JN550_005290 [Neoarthrinium moseri]KAI1870362.1 hypothetical protein JN550_005290 [Neoarthrinium moseri]